MTSHAQPHFLVGQAVNHVIGQLAIGRVEGGSWEVASVERRALNATVVFAVGYWDGAAPDDRPRVVVEISAPLPARAAAAAPSGSGGDFGGGRGCKRERAGHPCPTVLGCEYGCKP